MLITNSEEWSKQTFEQCELGDKRRTSGLIKIAGGLAGHLGESLVK